MNLPSLVHPSQHQTHFSPIPGHGHRTEHSMLSSHRSHHHSASYSHHEYHSHPPAPPPSPPVEDNSKCSLPSISTLLVYADCGPTNGNGMERQQQSHSPAQYHNQPSPHSSHSRVTLPPTLPPTPPMRPDSVFEGNNSPTMPSQTPSYFYSPSSTQGHRNSYPPQQQKSPVYSSPESPYPPPSSYYPPPPPPPAHSQSPTSMGYSKHMPPHPQHQLMIPVSVAPPSASNPWHHHHHSSPASHAAFPQSQDRYICQTCNKAFSRPSSLRIHSHSHTGEKPFKCPHHGCGKAFSVRSNMKRHERGCHQ